ncbi:7-deoxyloganetic acid glucosyltransferase-like [Chenopodium quinoa]|uniref:7-deoxyloganetic acid glucosyltransferase-like n=1 Tax=Chenopodium quinoa TaxID=63459 RepID=UPI000B7752E7|nr:7-deoxyloganetic acid glucosyltransferase-like [Chenopodium quinoa]
MEQILPKIPHVLIFPLPIQGAVNSMLKLAELILLASNGQIHITFLTTEHVHHRLKLHAKAATRFNAYPGFSLQSFTDGLPEDHPRGGDKFMEMLDAVEAVSCPLIREVLVRDSKFVEKPITCMIPDGLFDFALDVGKEAGIPVIYFDTISPSCLWVYLCLPKLIEAGEVPFQENDDFEALVNVPGMEGLLRRRDLPDFCRANNHTSNVMIQRISKQAKQFSKASGFILNTFEELEVPLLSNIRSHFPSVYAIGPVHLHLKERISQNTTLSYNLNSLWHEDRRCLEWLDQQPLKSVVFCSFGTQVCTTKENLMEFWIGLVNSGIRFLWVKRPQSVIGMDDNVLNWDEQIPSGLLKSVKQNGYVIDWVPQEEILGHSSIGGFLTHSGWNSTMESIVAGVPMICWPRYVDQLVISRHVSHVWKVGLDMKDVCDNIIIENMVREIMDKRKNEFLQKSYALANLATQSVKKNGSSYCSLDKLVDDIMSFRLAM